LAKIQYSLETINLAPAKYVKIADAKPFSR